MRLRVVADFDHKIELSDVCSDECASMGCGVFSGLNKILGIFIIYLCYFLSKSMKSLHSFVLERRLFVTSCNEWEVGRRLKLQRSITSQF